MINRSSIVSIAIITSLLTCGLMIPVWIIVGFIMVIVEIISPKRKLTPVQISQPRTILPSNDFVSNWDYVIIED